MSSTKRTRNDENKPFSFVDAFTPAPKRVRRTAQSLSFAEIQNLRDERAAKDAREAHLFAETTRQAVEEKHRTEAKLRVEKVLGSVTAAGYGSLFAFMDELLNIRDQQLSAQVSRMLGQHGEEILNSIRARQPNLVNQWAIKTSGEILAQEGKKLADFLRPTQGTKVSEVLKMFSLERIMSQAEEIAPTLCHILRSVGTRETSSTDEIRKDRSLVLVTVICMLAQSRSEHSSEFQTTMCIYLLACGASRTQFDVLNHAGFTLSYTAAVRKIKALGQERLLEIVGLTGTRAFMIIWDNLNIAFRVGEQRKASKDHFDNGTTATLIPLFDVDFGGLPLDLKPRRDSRKPIIDFDATDMLPTLQQVKDIEEAQLWHIEDILFDAFPDLRKRFKGQIHPPRDILPIPVHKTEQYPLPAMHIDESSLEGTLKVLDNIITKTLKLSGEGLEKHGVILCAGDQLTMSLLDKASASRRDDSDLVDNIGCYTEGQLGLFHVKIAADRMVANEYWGTPNSKSPWSLWKINSLLGRKAISAGWKAKTLPPFRPTWELILDLTLPAHILDGFRIYCPFEKLEDWVADVTDRDAITVVAKKVLTELCSAHSVAKLRTLPSAKRDVPLENIKLFNRDSLILRILKYAIKRGDVGSVINVLAHWMLMFRGTGKMPKYADALFHLLAHLKRMNPRLRNTFLKNWLANLSNKVNGFKEMDLLQEHQNFWAKVLYRQLFAFVFEILNIGQIIYNARGSNRSWEWLGMVTVSIFALRDVIRHVQEGYKIPFNSISHTSPATNDDIKDIRDHLRDNKLQLYTPERENNDKAVPVRDLLAEGAAYANTARAFKNFRRNNRKATNSGTAHGPPTSVGDTDADSNEHANHDLGGDVDLNIDDLAMDPEEFPVGTDIADFVAMTQEFIDEVSH